MPVFTSAILFSLATMAAGAVPPAVSRTVQVCVQAGDAMPWVVTRAQAVASKIFEGAGIQVKWIGERSACKHVRDETVVVRFSEDSPSERNPGALAYALPYAAPGGALVEVYYDRVLKAVERQRLPNLLGHVLAHEIAHILEGVNRHSEAGVMKAHWDVTDFTEMSWRPLPFEALDVELMRRGLERRASQIASRR